MRIIQKFLFCHLLLIGLIGVAYGQAGGQQPRSSSAAAHSIRGKIYMPAGTEPNRRIRVVLEMSTGGMVGEAFTDTVGNFEFRGLASGNYIIKVPGDGQTYDSAQESVELSGFMRIHSSQIYLRERNDPSRAITKKVLSAADTQEVPESARKLYEKGLKLAKGNKPQDAMKQYLAALEIFPEYLQALNKVGEQYLQIGQVYDAQVNFERALAVNTHFALPHLGLGTSFYHQRKFAEAVEQFELANKEDDSYPMGHVHLGLALIELKPPDYARAEKELLQGLALAGKEGIQVRLYLFNLYARQRQYEKAAAQLETFLKEKPEGVDLTPIQQKLEAVKKVIAQQSQQAPAGTAPKP